MISQIIKKPKIIYEIFGNAQILYNFLAGKKIRKLNFVSVINQIHNTFRKTVEIEFWKIYTF